MPSFKRFKERLRGAVQPKVETNKSPKLASISEKIRSFFGLKTTVTEQTEKLKGMTKLELDQYAEKYNIYLDRRQTKANMINEFLTKLKKGEK